MVDADGAWTTKQVERAELDTCDLDELAAFVSDMYVAHQPRLRCADPEALDTGSQMARVGDLAAGVVHWFGVDYEVIEAHSEGLLLGVAVAQGTGAVRSGDEEVHYARGDVFLDPAFAPHCAVMHECQFAVVQIPIAVIGELAEDETGIPADQLRFHSMAPVSEAAAKQWERTAGYVTGQLVGSGITEMNSLVATEMTRVTAASLLSAFPNTTMTVPYLSGPGWVAPVALRRAVAFIHDHADRPITVSDIAAESGISARSLQHIFAWHYEMTPRGYLQRVRLERAHAELLAADPVSGLTVDGVALRWGWARLSDFASAYWQRFGVLPNHTLRS